MSPGSSGAFQPLTPVPESHWLDSLRRQFPDFRWSLEYSIQYQGLVLGCWETRTALVASCCIPEPDRFARAKFYTILRHNAAQLVAELNHAIAARRP